MAAVKDHFIDLERHRRQLEDNVAKLEKALQHWRMSDAEYEQLKDEVEAIPEPATRDDLEQIREEFEGEVVTGKEVEDLFGKSNERSPKQIVNLLSRRIGYVTRNIETLEKQLQAAEQKLAAATIVINPDVRDEEGLPITDIVEELDDDDKVTSYRLQRPGDMQPQIREALAKAGIKGIPEGGEDTEAGTAENTIPEETMSEDEDDKGNEAVEVVRNGQPSKTPSIQDPREDPQPQSKPEPDQSSSRKAVSFAEDTKPGHDLATNGEQAMTRTAQRLEDIMEQARQQAIPSATPIIPEDEPADEAELRKEMLRYGMSEIAPIVAALEIDEEGDSEFEDAYDDEDDYDEDEFEDEHGRYKYRIVDDDYRARMIELEKKLGVGFGIKPTREDEVDSVENSGDEDEANGGVRDEGIARIAVQPPSPVKPAMKTNTKTEDVKPTKKEVKFASTLDSAPVSTTEPVKTAEEPVQPFVDPMKLTIVERSPAPQPAAPATAESKKTSRFKKAKEVAHTDSLPIRNAPAVPRGPADAPTRFLGQEEIRTAPSGPQGKTLAGNVLERDTPSKVQEPDEFDAALLHQEAAAEYHRMRNRMILRDGGFMKNKEAPIEYPEQEEEGGKRVSRFKAARLAKQ